jgi:hypothetical protein
MNVKKLVQGLSYVGEAKGKRQTYYVFRASASFLVLSFSRTKPRAGNFNIVDSKSVDYVRTRLGGKKGITARDVVARAKKFGRIRRSLTALNILYVLVALGDATVDARRAGPRLFFNIRRRRN